MKNSMGMLSVKLSCCKNKICFMNKLTYAPGAVIYKEGDSSGHVYLVKSGKVELVDTYPETGQAVSRTLGNGKVFGEVELMDKRDRVSTARAASEVKVLAFSQDEIMDLLFNKPEESLLLAGDVFDRLRDLYSSDSIDAEMAKLREEMNESIKQAVISHESRVVKSHAGMAAIAGPVVVLVGLVIGIQLYVH